MIRDTLRGLVEVAATFGMTMVAVPFFTWALIEADSGIEGVLFAAAILVIGFIGLNNARLIGKALKSQEAIARSANEVRNTPEPSYSVTQAVYRPPRDRQIGFRHGRE